MLEFIIRRILWTVPVHPPRHPDDVPPHAARSRGTPSGHRSAAIPESIQRNLEAKYGLDDPWYVAVRPLRRGTSRRFDLGPSLVLRNRDVNDIVREHFPPSLELGAPRDAASRSSSGSRSGSPRSARKQNKRPGLHARWCFANVGFAIPSFLVATLLIYFFAVPLKGDISTCRRTGGTRGRARRSCRRSRWASAR